ncbi:MAG: response regulator [Isosphaeraceae bacterium]
MWTAKPRTMRVLLVEDTAFLREALSRVLRRQGYEVVEASDGQAALRLLESELPDLVVTDLAMPVMDGIELIHRLRNDDRTATLPILVVTAEPTIQAERSARRAGAAAVLPKPLDVPAFLTCLQACRVS